MIKNKIALLSVVLPFILLGCTESMSGDTDISSYSKLDFCKVKDVETHSDYFYHLNLDEMTFFNGEVGGDIIYFENNNISGYYAQNNFLVLNTESVKSLAVSQTIEFTINSKEFQVFKEAIRTKNGYAVNIRANPTNFRQLGDLSFTEVFVSSYNEDFELLSLSNTFINNEGIIHSGLYLRCGEEKYKKLFKDFEQFVFD